ncbi:hypothetical protein D9758_012904 [Tetrapyrgos nigripes]|uniref:Uncharacterized protein n=1 Tax=Tetrapyrgos nigripes TaxID=182062 RepID=A0A8H5FP52_9AGAR|nr:hypothetical protein D9758_012904 [Tetrapyrgos nigripes]
MIDVDGQNNVETNPDRSVFVFAVHTIDPHSRINVPNQNTLRNLQYTSFDPNASPDARPDGPTNQAQQRFFAHAHAGLLTWAQVRDFMNQDPSSSTCRLPGICADWVVPYVQIGSLNRSICAVFLSLSMQDLI